MKIILFFLLLISSIFGCSLHNGSTPKVLVNIDITAKNKTTTFDIQWVYSKEFVDKLAIYDDDNNFNTEQTEAIKNILEDYTRALNYITNIKFISKDMEFKNFKAIKIDKLDSSNISFHKGRMIYNYTFHLDFPITKDMKMEINFLDINFDFNIKNLAIDGFDNTKNIITKQHNSQIYFFDTQNNTQSNTQKDKKLDEDSSYIIFLQDKLSDIKNKLQNLLNDIKQNNTASSYMWLLIFSFLYGIIHAIGPGHGKALVSAYFIGNNKSYLKAFNISLLIGVVHTFSAFLITLVIYFSLNVFLENRLNDIESIAIRISAVIIIAMALYLIYKKIKSAKVAKISQWSTHQPSCSCGGCNTQSSDIWIILAAGIIPCPGTITVFIFTMSLGIYFVGFLSAIFMSLGMSLIIFVAAYLSKNIRDKSNENTKLVKALEYGSLLFILSLGLFLFFIS